MFLSALFIYPVKSLAGLAAPSAEIDLLGLAGDRRFMVVDENGLFLTQRTLPRMALVGTALDAHTLTLSAEGAGSIRVPRAADGTAALRRVQVWKSENLRAEDCGDTAAAWLEDFLRVRCRLVRLGPAFDRPVLKRGGLPDDRLAFADACPFLVIGAASLSDLDDRLVAHGEEAMPMNRFRPNFVVSGGAAFAEDAWTRFRIGDVTFRSAGPCARCIVTTTDQLTAVRGKEPLRTLATYRRDTADPTNVNFGQNLIHETKTGTLRVGDPVEILD